MKFGLFMANEFMHAFTANLLFAVIFLGGWAGPFAEQVPFLGFVWLLVKTFIVYIPSLILRATIPRVRIDQMMSFNWKFLVPISIVNVLLVAFLLQVDQGAWVGARAGRNRFSRATCRRRSFCWSGNLALIAGVLTVLRNAGRQRAPGGRCQSRAAGRGARGCRRALARAHTRRGFMLELNAQTIAFFIFAILIAWRRARRRHEPQPDSRRALPDRQLVRRGGLLRPAQRAVHRRGAGAGLHRRDRHPDHLRGDAHAQHDDHARIVQSSVVDERSRRRSFVHPAGHRRDYAGVGRRMASRATSRRATP